MSQTIAFYQQSTFHISLCQLRGKHLHWCHDHVFIVVLWSFILFPVLLIFILVNWNLSNWSEFLSYGSLKTLQRSKCKFVKPWALLVLEVRWTCEDSHNGLGLVEEITLIQVLTIFHQTDLQPFVLNRSEVQMLIYFCCPEGKKNDEQPLKSFHTLRFFCFLGC